MMPDSAEDILTIEAQEGRRKSMIRGVISYTLFPLYLNLIDLLPVIKIILTKQDKNWYKEQTRK